MNGEQREQLRLSLLRFLEDNPTRFGLGTVLLCQMARQEGRPALLWREVEQELLYLHDKGLVTEACKALSPEIRAWRITAAGRDLCAQS
jgi:hypothetical protein